MKILITLIMTMAMTSAFADACKLDAACTSDADCKATNSEYAVVKGKCVNPKATERDTDCAGIVNTSGTKTGEAGAKGPDGKPAPVQGR